MASLPRPRGPVSEAVIHRLGGDFVEGLPAWPAVDPARQSGDEAWADETLALWVIHELSYRGFTDVDERWEWHPDLLALRWRWPLHWSIRRDGRARTPPSARTMRPRV